MAVALQIVRKYHGLRRRAQASQAAEKLLAVPSKSTGFSRAFAAGIYLGFSPGLFFCSTMHS